MNKTAWFWVIFAIVVVLLFLLTGDTLLVGGITLVAGGTYSIVDAKRHPLKRQPLMSK